MLNSYRQILALISYHSSISPVGLMFFTKDITFAFPKIKNQFMTPFPPRSYTAPDGTPIALSFTAGHQGYVPVGDHLPVAPTSVPLPYQRNDFLDH